MGRAVAGRSRRRCRSRSRARRAATTPANGGRPSSRARDGETLSAAYYHSCNRGKRSIAADFATPEGQTTCANSSQHADVLIENFKLGGLKKYGLDYDSLKQINPKLVYCSITGFGQDGPYAPRAGYDFIIQGMAGMMSITGAIGRRAAEGRRRHLRHLHRPLFGHRHPGGIAPGASRPAKAHFIDMALFDTQIGMLGNQNLNYLVSGKSPVQHGQRAYDIIPYEVLSRSGTAHSSSPSAMTASSNG